MHHQSRALVDLTLLATSIVLSMPLDISHLCELATIVRAQVSHLYYRLPPTLHRKLVSHRRKVKEPERGGHEGEN